MRMRLANGRRALAAHVEVVLISVCVDILLTDLLANLTA